MSNPTLESRAALERVVLVGAELALPLLQMARGGSEPNRPRVWRTTSARTPDSQATGQKPYPGKTDAGTGGATPLTEVLSPNRKKRIYSRGDFA